MNDLNTPTATLAADCFDRFDYYLSRIENIIKEYQGLVTQREAILQRFTHRGIALLNDPVAVGEMIDEIFVTAARMKTIEENFTALVHRFTETFEKTSLKETMARLDAHISSPDTPEKLKVLCTDTNVKLKTTQVRMAALICLVLEGLVSQGKENNRVVTQATATLNKLRPDIVIH